MNLMTKTNKTLATIGLICSVAGTAVLSGCTTYNAYNGERETSKATIGAGVGAASGALVGILTGGGGRGALIGAGVGAVAGGLIGHSMDDQQNMLRERLQGTGVQIYREGDMLRLVMPGDITFDNDEARIRHRFYPVLDSVSVVLREYNHTKIKIAGFTSNTGTPGYNLRLSSLRAESIANFLMGHGINPQRIVTVGYGERHPIASNNSVNGRAMNRRVEITVKEMRR